MQGEERFRLRERGSATRVLRGVRCMVALLAAFFLPGSVPAVAQEPVRTEPVVVTATRIEEKVSEQASVGEHRDAGRDRTEASVVAAEALQGIPGCRGAAERQSREPREYPHPGGRQQRNPRDGRRVSSQRALQRAIRHQLPAPCGIRTYRGRPRSAERSLRVERDVRGGELHPGEGGGRRPNRRQPRRGKFQYARLERVMANGGTALEVLNLGVSGFLSDGNLPNDHTDIFSFLGTGDYRVGEKNRVHAILLSTDETKEIPVDRPGVRPERAEKTAGSARRYPMGNGCLEAVHRERVRRGIPRISGHIVSCGPRHDARGKLYDEIQQGLPQCRRPLFRRIRIQHLLRRGVQQGSLVQ